MPPFAKPETVLKRSEELINVGQHQAALAALNEIFTSRRFKQTPLQALEPIMIRFVDLCVDLKKGRMAKEGLMQYKNVSQNTNAQSIELVIKHFIKLADAKVVEAQSKADAAAGEVDVDDLEESETPESMLLGSVSADQSKDRTDRVLVTPWLKFLWEAYRTALDILRNNARLEVPYQQIANQALKFCLQYERKTEFRRLCEVLRQHLQNVARYSHHAHAINLTDQDTLQRHLDTRFAQLNAAVELELWQEAFRSVEDIHNLLTMAKKAPRPAMMANYYEKLARIFMVSDNNLFHAAAWNRYYALARSIAKSDEEQTRMASYVLISALAVPVISSNAPGTGNLNKTKSDFLQGDQEGRSRTGRLTSLLGLSRTPTRAGLLKEALNRDILKKARPELRELYNILEVEFHPLSICAKIEPILASISQDPEMAKYVKPLHSVVLTRLFQQLSQVYDAVKLSKIMQLVSAFKAPHSYTPAEIEKFCLNACKKGHLNIRIDHVAQAITFQDDVFSTDAHPAASTSSEADNVRLQATPSELVRTQLSRLATCLDTTIKTIDPSILANAEAAKREVFARAVAAAEDEHKAAIARKAILARRKELLEEMATRKEREEAAARTERARAAAEAEQKRIAEETKKREQDRINKELEAVRIEEAKKMAKSLQERGGLKLSEEELANMDTNKLVQMQVEQIEKEKKELAERLRLIHRRMDHLERAYRREEAPLLSADYERQKEEDLKYHKAARITLLQTSKEKHVADLEIKKRLTKILPDYQQLRSIIEEKRRGEFEDRRRKATEQIELEKEKRRQQVREERRRERQEAEEAERRAAEEEEQERVRAEEEERLAEQRRVQDAERAELEAKKRAEIEERMAKLQAQADKQRQREEEAEANRAARVSGGAPGAARQESPAPAVNGGGWRSAGAARAAAAPAAPAAQAESQRPSIFGAARAGGGGGWREREAARKAAGGDAPAPAAAPAPAPQAAPQAAAPPASGAYRPGALRGAAGGGAPGGGWRERQAAKEAAGGGSPAPSAAQAQAPAQPRASDNDGFTEVKKSVYRPPGRRA
ncbi:Proteasome component (PCI) domain protein [Kalmanozyma brasiliensis GHG001]|uniref:Proteasome component (PCI) domain protein n=1 Tax=Kalmanozyma brasiliensis (strain GHG001) TaxID=1365824 RepID=UPI001CEBB51C|nr:Proteasome component (PCI) domain protein [Kalmanozyma brasiliensis GHG001]KAF6767028.1 Proteasome component (PCI) domain protein [Kalmanozyma brasiliensis GHG001]